jgi:hypothetical protein
MLKKNRIALIYTLLIFTTSTLLAQHVFNHSWSFYNDNGTYLAQIQYLSKHSFLDLADPGKYPWADQMLMYQHQEMRIGFQLFGAILMRIFRVESVFSIYPWLAVFGEALFLLSVVKLLEILKVNFEAIINSLLILTLGVNINLSIIMQGFMPQIYGIAMYIFALSLTIKLINERLSFITYLQYLITIPALMLTYQEIVPFLFITQVILVANHEFSQKQRRFFNIFKKGSMLALPLLLFFNITLYTINGLRNQVTAVVGWNEKINFFSTIGMVFGQDLYRISKSIGKQSLGYIGTTLSFFLFILGLYKLPRNHVKPLVLLSLPFALAIIYFLFFSRNPYDGTLGNYWNIYKIVQWSYWLVAVAAGIGLSRLGISKVYYLLLLILVPSFALNLKNLIINVPQTILREQRTTNQIRDYETMGQQNFQYKPANIYAPGIHFMDPYVALVALNDTSRGIFFPLSDTQLYIRNPKNIKPKFGNFHWIHYRSPHYANQEAITSWLGYEIYSPDTSFIYSKHEIKPNPSFPQTVYLVVSENSYELTKMQQDIIGKRIEIPIKKGFYKITL